MKYVASQPMGETPKLEWPGFSIPVHTSFGAECIANEMNRLDSERQKAGDSLGVQIEAKCKAINANQSNLKKLNELIEIQKSQGRDRYMTGMLNGLVLARSVLDGENPIYEDHQGGVELNEKQAAHIISTLDSLAITKFVWSPSLREAYEACVVLLGATEAVAAQGTGKSQAFEVVMLMSSPPQYRVVGPDTNLDFGTWHKTAHEVCARLNAQQAEREAREFKLFESNCEKKALEQRLAVRDQQARQLLPCPFCGGEPYGTHDHYVHDDLSPMPCVECRACSAHLKAEDWNRRAEPAAQPQGEPEPKASKKQRAALKDAISFIENRAHGPENINKHLRKLLRKLS